MPEPSPTPQTPPSRQLSPNPFIVLAFLLAIGLIGFGGYRASEYQGMQTLRTDAGHRLDLFAAAVDGIVNRYAHIPATIQLNEEVLNVMHTPRSPASVLAANRFLQRLNGHIGSIAIFVVDQRGIVLASSNWDHPDDSFIGEDLSFRSYYLDGLAGRVGRHFAIGITRGEPGYFVSHPIRGGERVVGVAVIKISLGQLDKAWELLGAPALIADGNGVVILSSVPEWRYTALSPLPLDTLVDIKMSRLYNDGPIGDFPVRIDKSEMVLNYVRQHGRIQRNEVIELCHLTPNQAGKLLTRLKSQGKLIKHGDKRGSYYTLAENEPG